MISLRKIAVFLFFCSANLFSSVHEIDYFPKAEFLQEYLNDMPWEYYKAYSVPNLGSFFVDSARDCVKDEIKAGKIWEPYILDVLARYIKPGDTVIDIGAHMGTITIAMSNLVGENGLVYSFEAERQFFRELLYNIDLNEKKNIKPHLAWIADENKVLTTSAGYGSNYSPVSSVAKTLDYPLDHRTLDSFSFENVALMKIDVECTENAVLEGAYRTIMTSRPVIVIEIMGGLGSSPSADTKRKIKNTIDILQKMNYKVSKIWIDDYLALPKEKF